MKQFLQKIDPDTKGLQEFIKLLEADNYKRPQN